MLPAALRERGRRVKTTPAPFTVVVDTREQDPFDFRGIDDRRGRVFDVATDRHKLDSGDYSILGHEDEVAVERKTKADIYGTIGKGRERFEREIERLSAMPAPAIVIQCDDPSRWKRRAPCDPDGERRAEDEKLKVPPCMWPRGECPLLALLDPPPHSRVGPKSVVNSLLAWSVRHCIPVWLCPSRRSSEILSFRLLQHFWSGREKLARKGPPVG
ncbi:MAG: hypothetical protein GF400_04385 [Candidatus Eisenbacteria bacterium]|nr:hypothetical protein [Candidatus Eisenbacteria bacterium]